MPATETCLQHFKSVFNQCGHKHGSHKLIRMKEARGMPVKRNRASRPVRELGDCSALAVSLNEKHRRHYISFAVDYIMYLTNALHRICLL